MTAEAALRRPASPSPPAETADAITTRLTRGGNDRLVLAWVVVWLVFTITGFRPPWQPIGAVEDANPESSLARQVVFTIGFLLAMRRILWTSSANAVLGAHLGPVALAALLVGSLAWSTEPTLTAKRSMIFVFGLALVLVACHLPRRPIAFYVAAVAHSTGAIAWISLLAHWTLPADCTTLAERDGLAGWSDHPNVLGPSLQLGLVLALGLPTDTPRQRTWRILQLIGIGFALVQTDSMTSVVSCLVGIGIWLFATTSPYRAGAATLGAAAIFGLGALVGSTALKQMFFAATGRDESLTGRRELWDEVLARWLERPLLGHGWGAFWRPGRGEELVSNWLPRQSHNSYVDVLADLGVLGLVAVVLVVHRGLLTGWLLRRGERGTPHRHAVAAVFAACASALVFGASGESFFLRCDKQQFFVLLWGTVLLAPRRATQ